MHVILTKTQLSSAVQVSYRKNNPKQLDDEQIAN